jgi:hypothetical protein
MIVELEGVLLNGADPPSPQTPRRQKVQNVMWPTGVAGDVVVTLVDEAGLVPDLTPMGTQFILTVRRRASDASPVISRFGSYVSAGKFKFALATGDTAGSGKPLASYRFDVQIILASKREQVVPAGTFRIVEVIGAAGDTPTGP